MRIILVLFIAACMSCTMASPDMSNCDSGVKAATIPDVGVHLEIKVDRKVEHKIDSDGDSFSPGPGGDCDDISRGAGALQWTR